MVSENVEGFQILPRLPNPALPNHVLPNTAYASKYCLCFQLPNSALPYQNCPQYGMLNLPESGSCPNPNPMVSENVEGFQILPMLPNPALPNHVLPNTAYASKNCLCFQILPLLPTSKFCTSISELSTIWKVESSRIWKLSLPTGENVEAELSILWNCLHYGIVHDLEAAPALNHPCNKNKDKSHTFSKNLYLLTTSQKLRPLTLSSSLS